MRSSRHRGSSLQPGHQPLESEGFLLRSLLAVLTGCVVGLVAGIGVVAVDPPLAVYIATIVLAGAAGAFVVAWQPAGGRSRPVTAVGITVALVLVVAAPRPLARGPDDDHGPLLLRTQEGHVVAFEQLNPDPPDGAAPLVFLHGGPGVSTRAQDAGWLAGLSRARSVVVYDQLGVGGSSRLEDPTGYGLQRARETLEQLRRHVGFDRMILVGHSWGAVVAANYTVHHPEHVEALLALSPGSLEGDDDVADDPSVRLRGGDRVRLMSRLLRPRELYTYGLSLVNLRAAHRILGDAEMDRRYDAILQEV